MKSFGLPPAALGPVPSANLPGEEPDALVRARPALRGGELGNDSPYSAPQVLPFNPASSVRSPKHVVKKGETPVLAAEEARGLRDGIDLSTLAGLRDRALIGVLVFSFARITAAVSMRVADTVKEICALMGISRVTLYAYVEEFAGGS